MLNWWVKPLHSAVYARDSPLILQKKSLPDDTSDADVMKATLRSVYLFPRITKKGEPSFLVPLKSAAASERLAELRELANLSAFAFTLHGIVSSCCSD